MNAYSDTPHSPHTGLHAESDLHEAIKHTDNDEPRIISTVWIGTNLLDDNISSIMNLAVFNIPTPHLKMGSRTNHIFVLPATQKSSIQGNSREGSLP